MFDITARSYMRKHLFQFSYLFIVTLFLWGCAGDPNEKANKLYVEASMAASKFLSNNSGQDSNYSMVYDSYVDVKDKLELILSKYPSSDIAVGLMSEKIKVSDLTLRQFLNNEDILREIKKAEQSPFSCAMLISDTIEDAKDKARILFGIAKIYAAAGYEEKVTHLFSKAFDIASTISDISTYEKCSALVNIAKVYAEHDNFEQAIALAETIDIKRGKSEVFLFTAKMHIKAGQKVKAAQLLSKAFESAKISVKYKSYTLRDIAETYIEVGLLDQALEVANSIDYPSNKWESLEPGKTQILLDIADGYSVDGQKEKALNVLYQVDETFKRRGFKNANANLFADLAGSYVKAEQKKYASNLLSIALEINNEDYNLYSKARILGGIATQYAKIGQEEKASQLLSQALEVSESIDKDGTSSEAMCYIICEYVEVAQKEKAVKLLFQLLERTDINLSCLSRVAGKFADLGQMDQAAAISLKSKFEFTWGAEYINLLGKFVDTGRMDQAFEIIMQNGGSRKSSVLVEFVDKYAGIGENNQTKNLLSKIFEATKTIEKSIDRCDALYEISQLYAKAGQKEQAAQLLSQAFEIGIIVEHEGFIFNLLPHIAIGYTEVGREEQLTQSVSKFLENAKNFEKDTNKIGALAIIAVMYDKMKKHPNSKDMLILHDMVSAIDPMSQLRVISE